MLSISEWERMEAGYLVYRAGSCKLGCNSISKNQPRWRQRPKGHMLEHLICDFHRLNPGIWQIMWMKILFGGLKNWPSPQMLDVFRSMCCYDTLWLRACDGRAWTHEVKKVK